MTKNTWHASRLGISLWSLPEPSLISSSSSLLSLSFHLSVILSPYSLHCGKRPCMLHAHSCFLGTACCQWWLLIATNGTRAEWMCFFVSPQVASSHVASDSKNLVVNTIYITITCFCNLTSVCRHFTEIQSNQRNWKHILLLILILIDLNKQVKERTVQKIKERKRKSKQKDKEEIFNLCQVKLSENYLKMQQHLIHGEYSSETQCKLILNIFGPSCSHW